MKVCKPKCKWWFQQLRLKLKVQWHQQQAQA
jgi:hypothetical protein